MNTPSHQFSTILPSLDRIDELKQNLGNLGIDGPTVEQLPPQLLVHLIRLEDMVQEYRRQNQDLTERLSKADYDVIRLRGQRDALRSAMMCRSREGDPLLGYASDHQLPAVRKAGP